MLRVRGTWNTREQKITTTAAGALKSGCQRKPGEMLKMSTEGGQQH